MGRTLRVQISFISSLGEIFWAVCHELWLWGVRCAEKQNRKLLEQLEEQKKRLRMQTQQQSGTTTVTAGLVVLPSVSLVLRV